MTPTVSLKIFVIDDDPEFGVKLTNHIATHSGYEVMLFVNGEEALKQLDTNPDVVIVDYHLDGTSKSVSNGMVLLEKIKDNDPAIHVIMLTALSHYGVAAQTIAKGANQCVIKDADALSNIDMILKDIKNEIR